MELESMSAVIEEVSSEAVSEIANEASGFIGTFFTDFANDFVAFFSNMGEIDVDAVMEVLRIMGLGMLGIFVVTSIIIALVTLLNYVTSIEKKKKEDQ